MVDTDGTQAPEPPKPFSDSLGGTPDNGSGGAAGAGGVAAGGENGHPPQPVGVNREAVQQLATALAAQEAASGGGTGSGASGASGSAPGSGGSAGADDEDDEPTAEIPPQRPGVRASAPALLAPIMRRRRPGQGSRTRRPAPQVRKPSAGSAGFVVALTLMLIFLIIAIQFVASFVESVTSIFG
ncbi:hypothetical protein ACWGPQ_15695 [Saccharomonospora azurea]|uniref:Uncharacterized protein n=1 Tax=Saccharomonospora azurea NA-128 TaxID=882081 RepID=H8G6E8_9PSEU|nr:hypothetical protein [Saccharomonospora azurea]EHY89250.1 hypothetical protein SacazDRAFT_02343 [Saccharomonospora azurea NA-128]